ncbi:hypothetical protein O9G_004295 [Rozella allomycis CSF55]|uniref:IP5PC-F beta-propeller domain-containing protein n=1 Tax=Rozella allomycis (strain CSF55) TaxID=988480 RepID=A0A075AVW0_ROZAC|nr:hypothetical protein O9G_004295 [Rozella allomycis CSF55]|eukprot:EPZ32852.1 hypothetical protein O9G_004295 [Rozella allomycis CSF55]
MFKLISNDRKLRRKYEDAIMANLTQATLFERSSTAPRISHLSIEEIEGRFALCGGKDGSCVIFDIDTKHPVMEQSMHNKCINQCQWYPVDTGMFSTCSMDMSVKLWDTNTMQSILKFDIQAPVFSHKFHSSQAIIAVGSKFNDIRLCDIRHKSFILDVAWSTVNDFELYSASKDGSIRLWDIRKSNSLNSFHDGNVVESHQGPVHALCVIPGGNFVASASSEGQIKLWDSQEPKNY